MLLAEPPGDAAAGNRDPKPGETYTRPGWKGKTQTKPVSYRKGGRKKNMTSAATPEMNSRSIWGPASKEFGGLAKASRIYENKQSNYSINDQFQEERLFTINHEMRKLISDLETKDNTEPDNEKKKA
jgi:hypothetical protein